MQAETTRASSRRDSSRHFESAQIALFLILGAETIFFGTLLSSFLFMRASASARPAQAGAALILPAINTLVLLTSALLAYWSERAIRQDQAAQSQRGLLFTFILGLIFICGQVTEFIRSGMQPSDVALVGMYFALITFHALHVLAGMVVLGLNLLRTHLGDFSARSYTAIQVGNWFWYYVTAVWLILFLVLYGM